MYSRKESSSCSTSGTRCFSLQCLTTLYIVGLFLSIQIVVNIHLGAILLKQLENRLLFKRSMSSTISMIMTTTIWTNVFIMITNRGDRYHKDNLKT
jgi:hypothetical protein